MDNVLPFVKKKIEKESSKTIEIVSLTVSIDSDGYYEVYADINEDFTDYEVYTALEAATSKFASDTGMYDEIELELENEE